MRVLCIEHEPSSRRGGQEWSMLDECRGLQSMGHPTTLGYGIYGDLLPMYQAANVRTLELGHLSLTADRLRTGIGVMRAVARTWRVPADLVCVNQYHEAMFGSLVARTKRIPLVCHLRLFPPDSFCGQWRIGVSQVTRFIAVSRAVKEAWVARGADPSRVDVVHDGVDMERFTPHDARDRAALRDEIGVPRDAFVVLFAGRLDRTKNLEGVLQTFAALRMPPERARLLIAGRPVAHESPAAGEAYVASLRVLADQLGITAQVHWLGSRPDVPRLLSAADASVLFQRYSEPLARAAYESLACGTPIVCQRGGGMNEVLSGEFERFTFDGMRPNEAVGLLRSLVGWRTRDPDWATRARAHAAAGFSKETMIAGIERSMRRALTTRPLHHGPSRARLREHHHTAPLVASSL